MRIQIEKPRLGIPISLIVDDPAPCINPLYYFRLQVDREAETPHVARIPLDFLEQFIEVTRRQGIRGKFSVLPYPAGLGSIVDGWPGCEQAELRRWIELARTEVAPHFDITPEILTHTLALDLEAHALLDEPEHTWMADRTRGELAVYFGAALDILKQAGFEPKGITQPCYFHGSRDDYKTAVLEAMRRAGGPPVTYYFIDFQMEGPPSPPPEVVLLDHERGEAVVDIPTYCDDYFWNTQQPHNRGVAETADRFITPDGSAGRLAELAQHGEWVIWVCHWQSLYSDESRTGLRALDEVAARLREHYGSRLHWMTLEEIARYRAASEACEISATWTERGLEIKLDSAFDCTYFTISVHDPSLAQAAIAEIWQTAGERHKRRLGEDSTAGSLLANGAWQRSGERLSICFGLRRGRQVLRVTTGSGRG